MDEGEGRVVRADVVHSRLKSLLLSINTDIDTSSAVELPKLAEKISKVALQFNEFELLPKLLDPHLQWYVDTILSSYRLLQKQNLPLCKHLAELIYVLTKIRGYKVVGNHFPNDVYDIPDLLKVLNGDNVDDFETYVNLLWLSTLVMVPFPLASIQDNLELVIAELAVRFITLRTNASKSQLMLLVLLSNLLTRPDCSYLLSEYVDSTSQSWVSMDQNAKLGHLMALNQIMKRHSNLLVVDLSPTIYSKLVHHDFTQLRHNPSYRVSSIHVLYLIKVATKAARIAVSKNDFSTVATILNNFIHDVLDSLGDRFDAKLREAIAKNLGKIVSFLNTKAVNYSEQLTWFVIDQLRIPELSSSGFVENLSITPENLVVSRYHTVVLFLGFLALTRTAPSVLLPTILSVFHSTCTISRSTFSFVQGSQIRDASCFSAWAVIRSLKLDDFLRLKDRNPNLWHFVFTDIMRIIIFDDDFTIRRCGIAVLQEFVGRFGSVYFRAVFPDKDNNQIGELTLRFIELFGSSTVSSLKGAHSLILEVIELGFPKSLFYNPLFEEMINKEVSFDARKLGGQFLSELCVLPSSAQWPAQEEYTTHGIVQRLIENFKEGDMATIYFLADFLSLGLLDKQQSTSVAELVNLVNFDHHVDKVVKAEALLHWFNAYFPTSDILPANLEKNVLSIVRLGPMDHLGRELQGLFDFFEMSRFVQISISELLRFIKHGNTLLAQTSVAYILSHDGLGSLRNIVLDASVSADCRAEMIASLGRTILSSDKLGIDDEFSVIVYALLDDYTLTKEGDVGLKIRAATLELLESNLHFAKSLGTALEHKLTRLAGEPMDKLRVRSFRLLCEIKSISSYEEHYQVYLSDFQVYFGDLILYYNIHMDEDIKPSFWQGMVHSSGALIGSNSLINVSLRHVLVIVDELDGPEVVITYLLSLLRIPPGQKVADLDQRTKKTFNMTLNVLGRIFDSGVEVNSEAQLETLFIRTYNLLINTNDATRILLGLKIFQYLSIWPRCSADIRNKSRKRLCWMSCFHQSEKVRALSSDSLFEIFVALDMEMEMLTLFENTKWALSKKTKADLQKLERTCLRM